MLLFIWICTGRLERPFQLCRHETNIDYAGGRYMMWDTWMVRSFEDIVIPANKPVVG